MKFILAFPIVLGGSLLALGSLGGAVVQPVELIADAAFERGVCAAETDAAERVVQWKVAGIPVWRINHHYSKSSYTNMDAYRVRADGFTFQDDYGTLDLHPADKSADFILGVNGEKEFGGVYRKQGEPWPHAYLTQRISNPKGHLDEKSPTISEIAAIDFSISIRLLQGERNLRAGHTPSRHAAQFLFFLTIQNLNRQSKGYGDYYWFGISLYDDRYPVTSLHAMQDKGSPQKRGTDKLIFDVGVQPFTTRVVAAGNWVTVQGDILPHIVAGLREAWRQGYLPASQEFGDYRIGALVLGWEITGLNDVSLAVKNLRTRAILAAGKSPPDETRKSN